MFHSLYLVVSKVDTVLMEPHTEHASLVLQQSVYRRAALSTSEGSEGWWFDELLFPHFALAMIS